MKATRKLTPNSGMPNLRKPKHVPGSKGFAKPKFDNRRQPQTDSYSGNPNTQVATLTTSNLNQHVRNQRPDNLRSYPVAASESTSSSNSSNANQNDRRYGIDDRSGNSVSFSTPSAGNFFTNPADKGAINTTPVATVHNTRLDVNVMDISLIGTHKSIAAENFRLIYRDFMNTVALNSNATATIKFTFENFQTYIDKVSRLYNWYYFLDSLLSFKPEFEGQCPPLEKIKDLLNEPEILELKYELQMTLRHLWLPSTAQNFLRWINQNYRYSELDNSQVVRIWPKGCPDPYYFSNDESTFLEYITETINDLKETLDATSSVAGQLTAQDTAIMTSALKSNVNDHIINELPLSCNHTIYDSEFIEIIMNRSDKDSNGIYPSPLPNLATERPYVTAGQPSGISIMAMATQQYTLINGDTSYINYAGILSDEFSSGGLQYSRFTVITDPTYEYAFHRRESELFESSVDFHKHNTIGSSHFSKTPSGKQLVYVNGSTGVNKYTREFQDMLLKS